MRKRSAPVAEKSATKSAPRLIPRPDGRGALLSGGVPGNIGGTGRPPDEFKAMCRELACSAHEAAALALRDSKHPAFIGALKWATEHGYGKPKETVEHTGKDGGPIQVWAFGGKTVKF